MSDLRIRIFNGARQLCAAPKSFLVTVTDGDGKRHTRDDFSDPVIVVSGLPVPGNWTDNYTILVSADHYKDTGYQPVPLKADVLNMLDLMLISDAPGFSFVSARWPLAKAAYPFLSDPAEDAVRAQARYEDFLDREELSLACLLNLTEAMSHIRLPQQTPLDYLRLLYWDGEYEFAKPPARDRFYAWCDRALVEQVQQAGTFVKAPHGLHPGATSSWKQTQFAEGNVQLTFHEDAVHPTHADWIIVEPDIDYYRNSINHLTLEVLPNLFGGMSDPIAVYVLRWTAGRTMQGAEFSPLYTLT